MKSQIRNKTGRPSTPALMIQGTSSDAGKTTLAAALCRVLAQDGYRVLPFKAQNMSLNSAVCPDGAEIGRAQAMQAVACGATPSALMNPVLLKPMGEMGSQVIVLGKARGIMRYGEYTREKSSIWEVVQAAYAELAAQADVVILEGAGSPAEINLRAHDLVNMAMAHAAGASVLLAADIDRGGAFASLAGTMELLDRADRGLVRGFVLNKFRGDRSLLGPALQTLEDKYRTPFVGVFPMLADLRLPDEDSVSLKTRPQAWVTGDPFHCGAVVGLADFPSISNFTDFDPFLADAAFCTKLVRKPEDLADVQLVLLPGSRNTGRDLNWLEETGLAQALVKFAQTEDRRCIVGICGGMQIMGQSIEDPHGLEGGGVRPGLGLLNLTTSLEAQKNVGLSAGLAWAPGADRPVAVRGYEIHHGQTVATGGSEPAVWRDDGSPLGWQDSEGRVYGTYLHGIWESEEYRDAWLKWLNPAWERSAQPGQRELLDTALDRMADAARQYLDMQYLSRLLGLAIR